MNTFIAWYSLIVFMLSLAINLMDSDRKVGAFSTVVYLPLIIMISLQLWEGLV